MNQLCSTQAREKKGEQVALDFFQQRLSWWSIGGKDNRLCIPLWFKSYKSRL
jgi:hypothetical protein